jgi:hypothetical protein
MGERSRDEPGVVRSRRRPDPEAPGERSAEKDPVLDLQRQAGNRAVAEILKGGVAGPGGTSPALRIRDALRAGRGAVQRELSLTVQRDLKSDTEEKEDPAEAEPFEEKMPSDSTDKLGGEEKMPSDSTDKLGGEEKMPSDSTDKFPTGEEKMPSDSLEKLGGEEKMPPDSTDKFPTGEEKMPSDDEEKMPSDSIEKLGGDEEKVFGDEEKLS